MMGAMKTPKKGQLVVQAMVPVLGEVICNGDDNKTPPERDPGKRILAAW
jgi:hypothetical protein